MVFRLRLDRDAGRVVIDERWRPRYGPAADRSYGWDPVITDEHVLWMDNGRNHRPDDARLRRAGRPRCGSGGRATTAIAALGRDQRAAVRDRVEPAGLGPEGEDRRRLRRGQRRPARLAADRRRSRPLWRRDGFAHAGHLILYPDTSELVAQDWRDTAALRRRLVRRALRPALQMLAQSAARAPRLAAHRQRPARRARPRQRRRQGPRRRALPITGLPVPRAGLRTRRLLPVAHHDRPGGGRLAAITRVMARRRHTRCRLRRLGAQSSTSG